MIYAQIKDGVVRNTIVLNDQALIDLFTQGFDYLIRIDNITPMPGIGCTYNNTNNTFYQSTQTYSNQEDRLSFSPTISTSKITTNQNDYNPTNLSVIKRLRLTSDSLRSITGIDSSDCYEGKVLVIDNVNTGNDNIKLIDNSSLSLSQNRFSINGDKVLGHNESCTLIYDSISLRWRMIGRST